MSTLGTVHLACSFIAIGAGAVVLRMRKGTRWHRTMGHAYAWSMVGVLVTAFSIYDLTGAFGPFHIAAVIATVALVGGLYTVLARRPKRAWMEAHAIWMSWSYIGLIAAFVAESATRFIMPRAATFLEGNALWGVFWGAVALASFAVFGVGARLVKTRLPAALAATPQAMRQEREELRRVASGS